MNIIAVEYTTSLEQLIYNKNFTSYKSHIIAGLEERLLQGIYENLTKLGDGQYLVLSQPEFVETNLPNWAGLNTKLQIRVEVITERPFYITNLKYKDQIVKPIEGLTFIERLKFLFFGKYPK